MKNSFSFFSIQSFIQEYLVKMSITHNKYSTLRFLEDNDPISAKSAAQTFVLKLAYTFFLSRPY